MGWHTNPFTFLAIFPSQPVTRPPKCTRLFRMVVGQRTLKDFRFMLLFFVCLYPRRFRCENRGTQRTHARRSRAAPPRRHDMTRW